MRDKAYYSQVSVFKSWLSSQKCVFEEICQLITKLPSVFMWKGSLVEVPQIWNDCVLQCCELDKNAFKRCGIFHGMAVL